MRLVDYRSVLTMLLCLGQDSSYRTDTSQSFAEALSSILKKKNSPKRSSSGRRSSRSFQSLGRHLEGTYQQMTQTDKDSLTKIISQKKMAWCSYCVRKKTLRTDMREASWYQPLARTQMRPRPAFTVSRLTTKHHQNLRTKEILGAAREHVTNLGLRELSTAVWGVSVSASQHLSPKL